MFTTPTKQQLLNGFNVIVAVTETIREAREIPEGTLYAALMTKGCDMETFEKIVALVVGSGLVRKSAGHLLAWVGPEIKGAN